MFHAGVHGFLLGAAKEGGCEGAVGAAGCEIWTCVKGVSMREGEGGEKSCDGEHKGRKEVYL